MLFVRLRNGGGLVMDRRVHFLLLNGLRFHFVLQIAQNPHDTCPVHKT